MSAPRTLPSVVLYRVPTPRASASHVVQQVVHHAATTPAGDTSAPTAADWTTAISTAVLAAFAIITAVFAFLAYRKQSQEVSLLLKDSERQALERRRAQASRIYAAAPRNSARLVQVSVVNASEYPVYDVQTWHISQAGDISGPDYVGTILPGAKADTTPEFFPGISFRRTILTFRDSLGVCWIRRPDGTLTEQTRDTARESVYAAVPASTFKALKTDQEQAETAG
jgi:hypothetical protein